MKEDIFQLKMNHMSLTREQWDLQFPNDPLPTYLGIDGQFIPERYIPFGTTNLKTHDVIVSEDGQYLMYFKEDKSYKIYDQSPFKFLVNPFKEWKKFGYELPVDDIKKSAVEYFKPLQEEFNKKLNEAWKHASQASKGNDMTIKLGFSEHDTKIQGDNAIPFTLDSNYFTPSIEDIETWKPVIGYEGMYEVSSRGRVKRVEYLLTESNSAWGYKQVSLSKDGKNSTKIIHRLVAQAFIENPDNKPTVNHKDCNKHNNTVSNLEWATVQENVDHAIENNLRPTNYQDGEKNAMAKLTKEDVLDIRERLRTMTIKDICELYPQVCYNTIYGIKTGKLWKNL